MSFEFDAVSSDDFVWTEKSKTFVSIWKWSFFFSLHKPVIIISYVIIVIITNFFSAMRTNGTGCCRHFVSNEIWKMKEKKFLSFSSFHVDDEEQNNKVLLVSWHWSTDTKIKVTSKSNEKIDKWNKIQLLTIRSEFPGKKRAHKGQNPQRWEDLFSSSRQTTSTNVCFHWISFRRIENDVKKVFSSFHRVSFRFVQLSKKNVSIVLQMFFTIFFSSDANKNDVALRNRSFQWCPCSTDRLARRRWKNSRKFDE